MQPAELRIVATSPTCISYRLYVGGRVVWSNRVAPIPAGHEGARARMATWALRNRVRVVEARRVKQKELQRA